MSDVLKEKVIRYRSAKDGKFAPIIKVPDESKDWYKNLPGKNQTAHLEEVETKETK